MSDRDQFKAALTATPECLSPAALEKLAAQTDSTSREPAESHLKSCPYCQTQLMMLQSFQSMDALPDEGAAVTWISTRLREDFERDRRATQPLRRRILSWAASLRISGIGLSAATGLAALAIAVGIFLRPTEPKISTGVNRDVVMRSGQIAGLMPEGDLAQAPDEFRWQPVSGAAVYRLQLMEVDETIVFEAKPAAASAVLPANIRAKILPGKAFLWRVSAVGENGATLAASPAIRFVVSSPGK